MTINAKDITMKVSSGGVITQPDNEPDPFALTDQTDVATNTLTESAAITVQGMDTFGSAATSVDIGEYQVNSGSWTSSAGTVGGGDSVKVRHTSSASPNTTIDQTLTIGSQFDIFSTTTQSTALVPTWTSYAPSADSRLIYVDATNGNDATAGPSGNSTDHYTGATPPSGTWDIPTNENAYRTVSTAQAQLRDGFPDYLLFKKGEVWTNETMNTLLASGRSSTERLVIGAYGTGARPLFQTGTSGFIFAFGGGGAPSYIQYIAIVGLHLYAHARDPGNAAYVEGNGSTSPYGIRWLRAFNDLVIEDNKIEYYCVAISLEKDIGGLSGEPVDNAKIRLNVLTDSWKTYVGDVVPHPQGIYLGDMQNPIIEYNYIEHCGWNATGTGGEKVQYNHGMYLTGSQSINVTARNNVVTRASANGIQQRPGHVLEDNFIQDCNVGLLVGRAQVSVTSQSCSNNIILNTRDDMPAFPDRGWGIDYAGSIEAQNNSVCNNNIVANSIDPTPGFAIEFGYPNVTYSGNIVHDWCVGCDTGVPSQYVDPERTIAGYNASVGGAGTDADFYAQLRAQSKDNWNPDYHPDAISTYFRNGFVNV